MSELNSEPMKRCWRCEETKDRSEFYRDKSQSSGLRSACKSCDDARRREWNKVNPERHAEQCARYRAARPERQVASVARWKAAHPEAAIVKDAVNTAIRSGRLNKPSKCERCNTEHPRINGHHPDYKKKLCVIWLCPKCHKAVHKETR